MQSLQGLQAYYCEREEKSPPKPEKRFCCHSSQSSGCQLLNLHVEKEAQCSTAHFMIVLLGQDQKQKNRHDLCSSKEGRRTVVVKKDKINDAFSGSSQGQRGDFLLIIEWPCSSMNLMTSILIIVYYWGWQCCTHLLALQSRESSSPEREVGDSSRTTSGEGGS